jgi:spermidine/putrescine transport system ATP-binding protein
MEPALNQYLARRRRDEHPDPVLAGLRSRGDAPSRAPGTLMHAGIKSDPRSPAVELRGVSVLYKGVAALSGIDLAIGHGEFFSLLGPSGCGKTSTLSVIGGFVDPNDGDVLIEGHSMRYIPAHRRPVNTVFQSYALFPHMSVAENIAFGPRMKGKSRAEIAPLLSEALRLVSLAGMEERRPGQLSGGQQQRVALARALVNRPSVLLLDEPLGALDLKLRKQMQLELIRIQREVGITFVYVTHDQEEAMTMSDRIAVMERGGIVQVGTPQAIYDRPANLFVANFIGSSNVLSGEIVGADKGLAVVRLGADSLVRVRTGSISHGRVCIVVRPDHMHLTTSMPDGSLENSIAGKITKVSFLGTHLQVAVWVESGAEISITQRLSSEQEDKFTFAVGDMVHVTWPTARSLSFPEANAEVCEGTACRF